MKTNTDVATQQNTQVAKPKDFFNQDNVKARFNEIMGKKSTTFIASVLQCVAQNQLLAKADVNSIYQAAMMAATLDLPINNNLGFAYIIPYNEKVKGANGQPDTWRTVAQFQLGYKAFIQLAQRSGQFKTISASPIYDGQLVSSNPLTGFEFDFTRPAVGKPIGYAAYFSLLNGFEKTLYMTAEELDKHGKSFSQTFKKGFGLWKDNFDSMALKTVTKLLLAKYAPLSVEMQKAAVSDQAIINDAETEDISYIDNTDEEVNKENGRFGLMVSDCKSIAELENLRPSISNDIQEVLFNQQYNALK